jgi:hypothetical protein
MFATANCVKNAGPTYNVFLIIKAIFFCMDKFAYKAKYK